MELSGFLLTFEKWKIRCISFHVMNNLLAWMHRQDTSSFRKRKKKHIMHGVRTILLLCLALLEELKSLSAMLPRNWPNATVEHQQNIISKSLFKSRWIILNAIVASRNTIINACNELRKVHCGTKQFYGLLSIQSFNDKSMTSSSKSVPIKI